MREGDRRVEKTGFAMPPCAARATRGPKPSSSPLPHGSILFYHTRIFFASLKRTIPLPLSYFSLFPVFFRPCTFSSHSFFLPSSPQFKNKSKKPKKIQKKSQKALTISKRCVIIIRLWGNRLGAIWVWRSW